MAMATVAWARPPKTKRSRARLAVWTDATDSELSPRDFVVKLEGSPARILGQRGPSDDLMLVVILDLTGALTLVDAARQALTASLDALPETAHVAIMRAQDGLKVLVDPTPDREKLKEAIEQLPVSGHAGLLETVETALRLGDGILTKTTPRLGLVYLTDSNVYNYREDFTNPVINSSDSRDLSRRFPEGLVREKISKLQNRAQGSETPLFIVHLDYRNDRVNEAYQTGLMELASTTGGTAAFCRSVSEIPETVSRIMRIIASHWSIEIELPAELPKLVQIQVENNGQPLHWRARLAPQVR